MSWIKQEKGFYKKLIMLALPVAGQNLISNAVGLTDTVMVGTLGDNALSATALANKYFFIFSLIIFGIVSGSSVLASQYWGKRDTQTIGKIFAIALKISTIVGLVFAAAALFVPRYIMMAFTDIGEIIELGADYLRVISPAVLIYSVSFTYVACMRSVERVAIGFVTQCISFFANLAVDAVFIFGLFGFPRLGVVGAAIGMLCARVIELAVMLVYAKWINKTVKVKIRDIFRSDRRLTSDFVHYATPVVLNESLWGLGYSLHSAIYGHMSSSAVAASNVVISIQGMLTVASFGVANAAAIIIGKSVGTNNFAGAKREARALTVMAGIVGIVSGALLLSTRFFIFDIGVLKMSDEAIELMKQMLVLTAAMLLFQALNCTTVVGILRGGGDTKFAMILDTVFLWGLSLPAGAIAAFVFHQPAIVVMAVLYAEEILKLAFGMGRVKRGGWMRNLTR